MEQTEGAPIGEDLSSLNPSQQQHTRKKQKTCDDNDPSRTDDKTRFAELFNSHNKHRYTRDFDSSGQLFRLFLFGPTIPDSIGDFQSLINLEVHFCNQISSLPASVGKLKNLRVLRISQCARIRSLFSDDDDDLVLDLTGLQRLAIESCPDFTNLPTTRLEGVGNLSELFINRCPNVTGIPDEFGQRLKNLKLLHLSECHGIATLPASVSGLENLEELHLNDCENLTHLPEELGNLKNLKYLTLWNFMSWTNLPQSIGRLAKLEHVVICQGPQLQHHNNMEYSLAGQLASIGSLPNLRKLILRMPTYLPFLNSIDRIDSLEDLHLRGCALVAEEEFQLIWEVLWAKFPGLKTVKLPLSNVKNLLVLEEQPTRLKSVNFESRIWFSIRTEIIDSGILQRIMERNLELYQIESLIEGKMPPALEHLRDLNRFGRLLVEGKVPTPPLSVWPTMLARAQNANVLYHLLRYNPNVAMHF